MNRKSKYRSVNGRKFIFSEKDIAFIRKNHPLMTNRKLADALNVSMTVVRNQCYLLGLYRMRLEYWTPEQVDFLKKNYKGIGDSELSDIFNDRFPKAKGWSKKHMEKKRRYLGLKRTREHIDNIHQRNLDAGKLNISPHCRFVIKGPAKDGTIRMWLNHYDKPTPKIKINGRWKFWNRWTWEKKYGRIPKGAMITFKDGNPYHRTISNLEAVSRSELTRRNAAQSSVGLSDNYVAALLAYGNKEMRREIKNYPQLIKLKRAELELRRKINYA